MQAYAREVEGRLQQGDLDPTPIDPVPHCAFIASVLAALVAPTSAQGAARILEAQASARSIDSDPSPWAAVQAEGGHVGERLENEAQAVPRPSTPTRIVLLVTASDIYNGSRLPGAALRVGLWIRSEQNALDADRARAARELVEADRTVSDLNAPLNAAFAAPRAHVLSMELQSTYDILASHGLAATEGARVVQVRDRLDAAFTRSLLFLGAEAFSICVASWVVIAVVRRPLRGLEADVSDAEACARGIPA